MKHLAIDLDDVVLDYTGGVAAAVAMEFGVELTAEDFTGWDLHPVLDPIIGRSWWAWMRDREWLWANFSAVPGAMGGLEKLRRQGFYLECVTSKPQWAEHNTWRWLGKWRPPFQRVTIVGPDDKKIDFTDAELLVDDKPANCHEFVQGGRRALMFARPHNRNSTVYGPPERVGIVQSWPELVTLLGTRNGLRPTPGETGDSGKPDAAEARATN